MNLKAITITTIAGLRDRSLSRIETGLVLLVGPNGIGKTAICRAVRACLFGGDKTAEVALDFERNGALLSAACRGGATTWQGDSAAPALSPTASSAYTVRVDELLAPVNNNEQFAVALRDAMTGGYKLAGLRPETPGINVPADLTSVQRDVDQEKAQQRELSSSEESLLDLREQVHALRRIAEQRSALGLVVELRKAESDSAAYATGASFPEGMERLAKDDATRLTELESRVSAKYEDERREHSRAEAANAAIADTGLDRAAPPLQEQIAAAERDATRAQQEEEQVLHLDLRGAATRVESACADLGLDAATTRRNGAGVSAAALAAARGSATLAAEAERATADVAAAERVARQRVEAQAATLGLSADAAIEHDAGVTGADLATCRDHANSARRLESELRLATEAATEKRSRLTECASACGVSFDVPLKAAAELADYEVRTAQDMAKRALASADRAQSLAANERQYEQERGRLREEIGPVTIGGAHMTEADVSKAADLVRDWLEAQADLRVAERTARPVDLPETPPIREIERRIELIMRWQTTREQPASTPQRRPWPVIIISGVLAVGLVVSAIVFQRPVDYLLAALAAACVVVALVGSGRSRSTDEWQAIEQEWTRSGFPPPKEWSEVAAGQMLSAARANEGVARLREALSSQSAVTTTLREEQARVERTRSELEAFRDAAGIDLTAETLNGVRIAQSIYSYLQIDARWQETRQELAILRDQVDADLDGARSVIVRAGMTPPADAAAAVRSCELLAEMVAAATAHIRSGEALETTRRAYDEDLRLANETVSASALAPADSPARMLDIVTGLEELLRLAEDARQAATTTKEWLAKREQHLSNVNLHLGTVQDSAVSSAAEAADRIDKLEALVAALTTEADILDRQRISLTEADRLLRRADSFLYSHDRRLTGAPPSSSSHEAIQRFASLKGRSVQLSAALHEFDSAQRAAKIASEDRERAEREIVSLLADRGVENGDELRNRASYFDEWRTWETGRRNLDTRVDTLRGQLEPFPHLLELTDEEARSRIEESERASVRADEVANQVGKLEQQVETAKMDRDYLDRSADVESKRRELAFKLDERLKDAAKQAIIDEVTRQTAGQGVTVLERASELLGAFTNGSYTLGQSGSANGHLVARLAGRAGVLKLEELSAGTRVQALIAARLAYIDYVELSTGERLPIFMDETLKHWDDDRMPHGIAAIAQIVRDGRQVFYLTNQEHEAERVRSGAEAAGVTVSVIDLAEKWSVAA